MQDVSIYINYEKYKELFFDPNTIDVKVNFECITFPKEVLNQFIYNQKYYRIFKKALFDKFNINIVVTQNEEIIIKKVYSPISILMGIKQMEAELPLKFTYNLPSLINKIDFRKFISKNKNKIYKLKIDSKIVEFKYIDLMRIILDKQSFELFLAKPKEECMKHVFALKEFINAEHILLAYSLLPQNLKYYEYLIQNYDTEAFNKNVVASFKYSNKFRLNDNFEAFLLKDNISDLLKKVIYLYLNLTSILKYDFEYIDDSNIVKKHKDFTRIEYIEEKNNIVTSYEFSLIFAKCLEKLNVNFDYNDNYIVARIDNFILKFKALSADLNLNKLSILEILKTIEIMNDNENSQKEFAETINNIAIDLNNKKNDKNINNLSFKELNNIYKTSSSKRIISFKKKYEIFYKLISDVKNGEDALGYIFELKKILFSHNEINANIQFNIILEDNNPVIIITVNNTNINLYNSNKYLYYNPPKEIEEFSLNELRMEFFKGRFKYQKNAKENIIGLEKSNI